jgi:glycine cleavage system T protein
VTGSLPPSARAVIVGGGIAGASVAYHLAQREWEDVVLVEQGPLWETGGSTSHAPGLMFQLNPSRTMTQLAKWSVELYGSLEVDELPCFYQVGGIEVAATDERWAELDRRYGRALSYGLDAELLDPEAVREHVPLIDMSRIHGGIFIPTDGIGKGVRAAKALGAKAIDAGVRAFADCTVTGFDVSSGRVTAVETSLGRIRADHVVLCAGLWGPRVAARAGVRVPLVPVVHQYAVTAQLPELAGERREVVHPILRHQDRSMYFRQVQDAYGIGSYYHEPLLVEPEDVEESGRGRRPSEQPFTPDVFAAAHEEAGRLLPALRDVELVRAVNGLMSFTPDGFPLLGESGAVRGLWLAEAIWVTHAGGAGRVLADTMTHGEAGLDMHECDPERFDDHGTSKAYARARGAQQYREVYDVIHPRQPPMPARPLRASPFYPRQIDLRAVFFESAGWERPQWYEVNEGLVDDRIPSRSEWSARLWSPIVAAEHRACRERVGIFDATPFTKVRVSGPGALPYLGRLAANDVDRPPGTIVYTSMLSHRGGIMCDLTITRLDESEFLVVTGGSVGKHDLAWMRRHVPGDGSVHLEDQTSSFCCVGVWGPRARDLVASVSEVDLSNDAFPYMSARRLHIGLVPVLALRISYVGELGWEIYAPAEFGLALWDTLWDAGAAFDAVACGGGAYDSLRLEKGYRLWGADIDEEHNPYEAGLGFVVKLQKGDFLGREAAARAKEDGVERKLCCLVMDDPHVVLVGKEPILDGERVLGYVTSAGWGATMEESIAYGYLPVSHAEPGTRVSVHSEGRREAATVSAEPLFDPGMARLRDVAAAAAS